jgi:Zn-dependent M32 family carboxypeptidase
MGNSLQPWESLVHQWANGARVMEIERVMETLRAELRRRGVEIPCQGKRDEERRSK